MGEARRRKLAGLMPEKTNQDMRAYCAVCRGHYPLVPFLFERPAVAAWPAVCRCLYVCRVCQLELDRGLGDGRMSFPGSDLVAKTYKLRLEMLTGRPWQWRREPARP